MKGLLSGLIALLIAFGGGYWYGKHVEAKAQQAEVDRLNAQARVKEEALGNALVATTNALRKTNEKAKLATKQRDAAIDSGALRLRVKTTCPVSAATDPSPAAGDSGRASSAELDRETAKALIALTEEGDRAITKLNACITLYNNARSAQ
jgi:prophage endopeptidase